MSSEHIALAKSTSRFSKFTGIVCPWKSLYNIWQRSNLISGVNDVCAKRIFTPVITRHVCLLDHFLSYLTSFKRLIINFFSSKRIFKFLWAECRKKFWFWLKPRFSLNRQSRKKSQWLETWPSRRSGQKGLGPRQFVTSTQYISRTWYDLRCGKKVVTSVGAPKCV